MSPKRLYTYCGMIPNEVYCTGCEYKKECIGNNYKGRLDRSFKAKLINQEIQKEKEKNIER